MSAKPVRRTRVGQGPVVAIKMDDISRKYSTGAISIGEAMRELDEIHREYRKVCSFWYSCRVVLSALRDWFREVFAR